jgi:hypothetical protein
MILERDTTYRAPYTSGFLPIYLLQYFKEVRRIMDTQELITALTPLSMADLDKLMQQGSLTKGDAELVKKGFFTMRNTFIERFGTPANYLGLSDAEREAYIKNIEDAVWMIQSEGQAPGHLHIAVGMAVFCKELEGIASGEMTAFFLDK